MNIVSETTDKDTVLAAFIDACPVPTQKEVLEWRERYPDFASDIIETAFGLFELSLMRGDEPVHEPTAEESEQSRKEMAYLVERERHKITQGHDRFITFGERAKKAREARGLTLDMVAKAMGQQFAASQIDALEKNDQSPRRQLLVALARVLKVSMTYLLETSRLEIVGQSPRNSHHLSAADLQRIEIEALDFTRRYLEVEMATDMVMTPADKQIAALPMESRDDAETCAAYLRQQWQLNEAPIKSLVTLLEDKGVKILLTNLGKSDGFALWMNEAGLAATQIIVIGKSWNVTRRRFTLAHELGHLLAPQASEAIIDRFAGAFLLPQAVLRTRFEGKAVHFNDLIGLKREFGISPSASIERLHDLNLIDAEKRTQLYGACDDMKGEGKREPLDGFHETPERFKALCLSAFNKGYIEPVRVAELLDTSVAGLQRMRTV